MKIKVNAVKITKGFNPRAYVSPREVAGLKQSFNSELGQIAPIIIRRRDNELIDGLHRLLAAKRSKRKYIEAVPIDVDDARARRMSLAANSLTEKLHPLEIGKVANEILSAIKRYHGREKLKRELAKELGIRPGTLARQIVLARHLSPEAWTMALKLSKQHLLPLAQIDRVCRLDHANQLLLLRRAVNMKDPILVGRYIEGFLETQRPSRNLLGRPRGSKTEANHEVSRGSNALAPVEEKNQSPHDVREDRREQTKRKLEEWAGVDAVDVSKLEFWRLLLTSESGLQQYRPRAKKEELLHALENDLERLKGSPVKATATVSVANR